MQLCITILLFSCAGIRFYAFNVLAGGLLTGKHGGAGAMAPLPNSRFADDEATPMKSAAMCANECRHNGTVHPRSPGHPSR